MTYSEKTRLYTTAIAIALQTFVVYELTNMICDGKAKLLFSITDYTDLFIYWVVMNVIFGASKWIVDSDAKKLEAYLDAMSDDS